VTLSLLRSSSSEGRLRGLSCCYLSSLPRFPPLTLHGVLAVDCREGGKLRFPDHGVVDVGPSLLGRLGVEKEAHGHIASLAPHVLLLLLGAVSQATSVLCVRRDTEMSGWPMKNQRLREDKKMKVGECAYALQSVPLPNGPVRHSGVESVPQC
jgi:hypothetical protein